MIRMIVLVSLVAVQLGAADSPCAIGAPAASTTPSAFCDTPLCKGLVGAGAGVAGLAAIGGIAGALAAKGKAAPKDNSVPPVKSPGVPAKSPGVPAKSPGVPAKSPGSDKDITVPPVPGKARNDADDDNGSNWWLPVLLGVLALCCVLGLIGYLCMGKKSARKTKVSKKTPPTGMPKPVTPEVSSSEVAPLMGHWEQPMQVVPVTTTSTSYTPAVVERAVPMAAPTYAMPTVVEPVYAMAAPTYAMSAPVSTTAYEYVTAPAVVETIAPTYAAPVSTTAYEYVTAPAVVETIAPTYAATTGYATAPTTVVETVAPTYAATTGYATAPTTVVETVAPTYAATTGYATAPAAVVETVAPTYAASYATAPTTVVENFAPTYAAPTGYATGPTAFAETVAPTYAAPGYVV